MIGLQVTALMGHYGRPGSVKALSQDPTLPFAPPSTIKGFIESMTGRQRDELQGEFAYAYLGEQGKASILRTSHVWMSGSVRRLPKKERHLETAEFVELYEHDRQKKYEHRRPTFVDSWYVPRYAICVRGSAEGLVRKALIEGALRSGVLSLGTSDDMVTSIVERMPEDEVPWIVPGQIFRLTARTEANQHRPFQVNGTWKSYGLCSSTDVPEEAWAPLEA